jgi:hypothetical protein
VVKKKIAIVHYLPIEYYPPVTNFIRVVSTKNNLHLQIFTTHNAKNRNVFETRNARIYRTFSTAYAPNNWVRLLGYFLFNALTFLRLCWFNPLVVLYYESYSAMPVYWYFKLFGKNKKLWMHAHEYFNAEWYSAGMKTVKLYHQLEVNYLYRKATGLSQTNDKRAELFLNDYPFIPKDKVHVVPNYPPLSWFKPDSGLKIQSPLKVVYMGSLSIKNTFITEFCEWVLTQKENVIFDIYAYNIEKETRDYLENLASSQVRFFEKGVEYDKIPEILSQYHIGLILYKNFNVNFQYNETNKLFEYLVCGLDVWYSSEMEGPDRHKTKNTYPKVVKTDFSMMNLFDLKTAINRENCSCRPFHFECESVYEELLSKLLN